MIGEKIYLGDGAYYQHDGHSIRLTTENGISVTNSIMLEAEVLTAFIRAVCNSYSPDKIRAVIDVAFPVGDGA